MHDEGHDGGEAKEWRRGTQANVWAQPRPVTRRGGQARVASLQGARALVPGLCVVVGVDTA